jgi:hypothetical protein
VAKTDKSGRKERLAAALRENLKRRKARARTLEARETAARTGTGRNPPPSDPGKDKKAD